MSTSVPLPPVDEVVPGLWVLPVPIPINPLRYVLVHAFEIPDGFVLVDCGWNTPEAWEALGAGLQRAGGRITDVRGVLVTHVHPDHYGLAGRIREVSGAWVAIHPADAALIGPRYRDAEDLSQEVHRWLVSVGAPEDEARDLARASRAIGEFVIVAEPDVLLEDRDRPDVPGWDLVAIHTPGHTPGHLCFRDERHDLLLTGDHVLPRITPNVSLHPQSGQDPLGDFLSSLDELRTYADALALPGHEWRFDGLGRRLDELIDHHERRLDTVEELIDQGAETVWQVAERMSWSRPWQRLDGFMRRLAVTEMHAHLALLERRGRITRIGEEPLRWRLGAR